MRQKLGKYQLKEYLGSGTFGTVYRAIDEVLGREVAVKILKGSGIYDSELVTAFYNEARRSAQQGGHGRAVEDFTEAIKYRDGYVAAVKSRRDSYIKLGMNRFAEDDKDLLQKLEPSE